MSKKIYVITVSKVFPKGHPRAGEPTGFVEKILNGEKIHTIRENYAYWKMVSDKVNAGTHILSFRTWNGVPYDSEQTEFMELSSFGVIPFEMVRRWEDQAIKIEKPVEKLDVNLVAKNDGLSGIEFYDWFFPPKTAKKTKWDLFTGAILHFTDFRY